MNANYSFGYWLRRRRKALDMTQAELARQVGCAEVTIRLIEADERRPSRSMAERLAACLVLVPEERAAFLKAARADLAADQLAVVDHPVGSVTTPPSPGRGSLPLPPTPLLGRAQAVASVRVLVERPDVRLLTLTGAGGSGKTRLAVAVARALQAAFTDGAYFVALASVGDPALVASAIAQTLGVVEVPGQSLLERLTSALRTKHLLLLLDNFEHVLAAAPVVGELLALAPHLKILVTSRAFLHLSGEYQFLVPPLQIPDLKQLPPLKRLPAYAAITLFCARAQAVQQSFTLTPANAYAVAALCARLDELPLAIELAAARVKLLPPETLLARLARPKSDSPFHLLTGGPVDQDPKHHTLQATIDWSYHLLDTGEQMVLRRCAVFAGGWTLEAAEAVCNATGDLPGVVLGHLASLIDKSLVLQHNGEAFESSALGNWALAGEPRFTMLETIRAYALEQLAVHGEAETLRRQHAAYYLALAETAEPELRGPHQAMWLARLEQEHDNLRAVLAWSTMAVPDGQASQFGLQLAVAVWDFWSRRGYLSEGRRWLAVMLAQTEADPDNLEARQLRAKALSAAGNLAMYQGDGGMGQTLLEESLALFEALGDSWGRAYVLLNLGVNANRQGDVGQAVSLLEESLMVFRNLGDRWGSAWALEFLSWGLAASVTSADRHDSYSRAIALEEESLADFRACGDLMGTACVLGRLGRLVAQQGDARRARVLLAESLKVNHQLGTMAGLVGSLLEVARLVAGDGQQRANLERATQLYGAAEKVSHVLGTDGLTEVERAAYEKTAVMLQMQLGDAPFAAAWAEGRTMAVDQIVAYALAEDAGGDVTSEQ